MWLVFLQLAEVLKHTWFTANHKDEIELELPMKEVVQVLYSTIEYFLLLNLRVFYRRR